MEGIRHGDNLAAPARRAPDGSVQMAYVDPPFNTGRTQARRTLRHGRDRERRPHRLRRPPLRHHAARESSYRDAFDDYLGFLEPRLREVRRAAAPDRARCTSTSTTARRTTASCCSTSCSAASASSTS